MLILAKQPQSFPQLLCLYRLTSISYI